MAADRAGPYSVRRPLVLAILAIAARRRRAARRARAASRSYDCGAGCSGTVQSWSNASGGISSRPTNPGAWTRPTFVVQGRWCYLYRAIDSAGATIDFLLSALRDADAAKQLFRKALSDQSHPQPRVINTDLAPIYGAAIADIKKDGILRRRCRHRPVQYLNNILEQDHRAIKRRVNAKQGFREFQAAWRTIQGYEAMNMIRKGQARWVGGTNVRHQIQFIQKLFELPA
jgi:transposase, IS6 family